MIIRSGKTAPCELFDGSRVIAEGTHTYCMAMQKIWVMTATDDDIRIAREDAGKTE